MASRRSLAARILLTAFGAGTALTTVTLFGACSRTGLEVPDAPVSVPAGSNAIRCDCVSAGNPDLGVGEIVLPPVFACLPRRLNPNRPGGELATDQELEDFCRFDVDVVLDTVVPICVDPIFTEPGTFATECHRTGQAFNHVACDSPCPQVVFDPVTCDNYKDATVFCAPPTLPPDECGGGGFFEVCRVPGTDPPIPLPEGLAGSVGTKKTHMQVTSGQAVMHLNGEAEETTFAGRLELNGGPCPGASCSVSLAFDFDIAAASYDSGVFLADDVEFTDLHVNGATTPDAATVDELGFATFPGNTVQAVGRGTQSLSIIGFPVASSTQAFLFQNGQPLNLAVDWIAHTFSVSGELTLPAGDDANMEPEARLVLSGSGNILNEPPRADGGGDKTLECTSFDGADVVLDASMSSDPDDNIVNNTWIRGTRIVDEVLGFGPTTTVVQSAGITESYFLRVLDGLAQADDDLITVAVEDTTPPDIASVTVTPSCLWPPNHKYVRFEFGTELLVEASDVCDPSPTVRVSSVTSSQPDDANGNGDGNTTSDILFDDGGFCVRSERGAAGGAGRQYTITVAVTDGFGNESTRDVVVTVPHALGSADPDCEALPPAAFIATSDSASRCTFGGPIQLEAQLPPSLATETLTTQSPPPSSAPLPVVGPSAVPPAQAAGCSAPPRSPKGSGAAWIVVLFTPLVLFRRRGRQVGWCLLSALMVVGCKSDEAKPTGTVTTFAGNVEEGYVDAVGTSARFNLPGGLEADDAGGWYVADSDNRRIRHVDARGTVTTIAGGGPIPGLIDGEAFDASFYGPSALAKLSGNRLVIVDSYHHAIRQLDLSGAMVSTVAGGPDSGFVDGALAVAKFNQPGQVVVVPGTNRLFVADAWNNAIRRIDLDAGQVTTLAGNGEAGQSDGTGGREGTARFFHPMGVSLSLDGAFLFVGDHENGCIRRVDVDSGETTTYSGKCGQRGYEEGGPNARWFSPTWMRVAADGTLYVCDHLNHVVRGVAQGKGSFLVAGIPTSAALGRDAIDGPAAEATFRNCWDVYPMAGGRLMVTDRHTLRLISP